MDELKPCPFCGGEAGLLYPTTDEETRAFVICTRCGARSKEIVRLYLTVLDDGEKQLHSAWEEATNAWNRRAGEESKDA